MEIVDFIACTKCDDSRALSGAGDGKCSHCHGAGTTRKLGRPGHRVVCPKCKGTGKCPHCNGLGIIV